MYIFSYYFFIVLYALGFLKIIGIFESGIHNFWQVLLVLLAILIGWVLSIITQLTVLSVVGEIRKNKGPDNRFNHKFGSALLELGRHLLNVKVIVTNKELIPKDNKFILMGNHQENYDIILLKPIFKNHNINFIAKESLMKVPILGKWIRLLGNVPITKDADRAAAESIVKAIKLYKQGIPMGIFPEGKRSFSNEMVDFKAGAFKLAMKPQADILVVTLYNVCNILKHYPKRQIVRIHFTKIVKYEDYKGMNSHELSDYVKGIIQNQIDEFAKVEAK